jgi:hypothetical protein
MKPVDREGALEALQAVQALSAQGIDDAVTAEIGEALLGVFHALARASAPGAADDDVARRVHLMILAWLVRGRIEDAQART